VRYSPNSILAVRAAHARTRSPLAGAAAAAETTTTTTTSIGYSPSLPPGTLSPNETGRRRAREMERKVSRTRKAQVSLLLPQPAASSSSPDKGRDIERVGFHGGPRTAADTGQGVDGGKRDATTTSTTTVLRGLYRRECDRAGEFVDYMTTAGGTTGDDGRVGTASSSSPESAGDESGDLELTFDGG
jgi:hypothetical protein